MSHMGATRSTRFFFSVTHCDEFLSDVRQYLVREAIAPIFARVLTFDHPTGTQATRAPTATSELPNEAGPRAKCRAMSAPKFTLHLAWSEAPPRWVLDWRDSGPCRRERGGRWRLNTTTIGILWNQASTLLRSLVVCGGREVGYPRPHGSL
jgi:hypothetical protein